MQTIQFADAGPVTKTLGEASFSNLASGGAGTGAITYASSNNAVATINATTGEVTIIATGVAQITATKAADSGHLAAQASYALNVAATAPLVQTILFADAGPISRTLGEPPFSNLASGGASAGAITYVSSNSAVATIDASTGEITIVAVGTAQITATKAADSGYLAAQASFTLNIAAATPIAQTISFADAGPVSKTFGDPLFSNPASGGAGTGVVTYASTNNAVATVNSATGVVTIIAAGMTQIVATKAADSGYLEAHASYALTVAEPQFGTFTAWIGDNDTEVAFPAAAAGAEFFRSLSLTCSLAKPAQCLNGQSDVLTNSIVADSNARLNQPAWYLLRRDSAISPPVTVTRDKFSERVLHQMVAFDGKLWIIGGPLMRDVWSSTDGRSWRQVAAAASFPQRSGHQVVVFGGRMWVIGGYGGGGPTSSLNDVWSSTDGATWTRATAAAAFSPRSRHQVAVLNGRMWLVGGGNAVTGAYDSEVWSSTDGVTWTLATTSPPFVAGGHHQLMTFKDRLWVITGNGGIAAQNGVWSSTDGVNWTASGTPPFPSRFDHRAAVFDDRIWVTGGRNESALYNDVWSSMDGSTWIQATPAASFSPRQTHAMAGFGNRLWLVGGDDDITDGCCRRNDVWSTVNGAEWTYEHTGMPFPTQPTQRALILNDRLWIVGSGDPRLRTQVWSSADGDSWTRATAAAAVPTRYDFGAAVFGNRMWVVGGRDGTSSANNRNDVWSSTDGVDWTLANASAAFSPRFGHQIVGFRGRLWLIGGYDGSGARADVWSSSDGITWTQDVLAATFGGRRFHRAVVFQDRLWVIGGRESQPSSDVWSTSDGTTWVQETAAAPFESPLHEAAVLDGSLRVIVGNTVWSSSDGVNWVQQTGAAAFEPRSRHAVAAFRSRLWVIGGDDVASDENIKNEIWSSPDGVTWRLRYQNVIRLP